MSRILAAAVVLALLPLAGCAAALPVTAKTNAIAAALEGMPGVADVTTYALEPLHYTAAQSQVFVDVETDATADELATVIDTFAAKNLATGIETVSTELQLLLAGPANRIDVQYSDITSEQSSALTTTWLDLRSRYTSADLIIYAEHPFKVSAAVVLGGTPGIERDLTALYDARQDFATLGAQGSYTQVDGSFDSLYGLPDDAWLAYLDSLQSFGDFTGTYSARDNSLGLNFASSAAVDALVDTVLPGAAVTLTFDDSPIYFSSASCDGYTRLQPGDHARVLLEYWARDGRTLVDGSPVASCFAG